MKVMKIRGKEERGKRRQEDVEKGVRVRKSAQKRWKRKWENDNESGKRKEGRRGGKGGEE